MIFWTLPAKATERILHFQTGHSTKKGTFVSKLNMPFQACLYGQVAWLWQFVSTSDMPDQNNKPKRNFRGKLGQSLTFDLAV